MAKGKGRAKGKAINRKAAAGAKVGRAQVVGAGPWENEHGNVTSSDGAMALIKLDCKDVAQAIQVERLKFA